jgi:hypothetical protein
MNFQEIGHHQRCLLARRRLYTLSEFSRHPNSSKRATEWIRPGGINRSVACLINKQMAGLPYPHLFCEKLVGGSAHSPPYGWLAELLERLQPQLDRMRIVPGETFTTERLESRLRDAVVEARSQVFGPGQVCAWARL